MWISAFHCLKSLVHTWSENLLGIVVNQAEERFDEIKKEHEAKDFATVL